MDTNISNNLTARELISIAILSSSVASIIVSSLFNWFKDWWNMRKQEEKRLLKIKENSYKEIMENIDFIYIGNDVFKSEQKRKNFIQNYRMMFLYSDDKTIREINNILEIVSQNNEDKDDKDMKNKKKKIANSMIAIRRNMNKRTKLTEADFKHAI